MTGPRKARWARTVTAACLAALAVACGSGAKTLTDADADADAPGHGTVTISTESPIELYYRQSATIEGTYRDATGSGDSVYLDISLQGTAHDTTLGATSIRSGADGVFSFTLTAGTLAADFLVRVAAEDGAQDEIAVHVTEPATDSLEVDAVYPGRRRIDVFMVEATDGTAASCPELTGETVESTQTEDDALPFDVDLPESVPLALVVSGAWCPDACSPVAHACEEELTLDASSDDSILVYLEDDLSVFGATYFDVILVVDTSTWAAGWVDALLAPLGDLHLRDDDPAHLIIDGIHDRIVTEFGTGQGDVFVSARLSTNLDITVDAALGVDASVLTTALRSAAIEAIAPLRLEGTLEGDFWTEADQTAVHEIQRMGGASGMAEAPAFLAADPVESEVTVGYRQDIVTMDRYALPAGLGETLAGLMRELVLPALDAETAPWTILDHLEEHIDCALVASTIMAADATTFSSIADEEWYRLACRQVLAEIAAGVDAAAAAFDADHPALEVEGECDFLDTTMVGRSDGSCQGTVSSARWGTDTLTGDHLLSLVPPS